MSDDLVRLALVNPKHRQQYEEGDEFKVLHLVGRVSDLVSMGRITSKYLVRDASGSKQFYVTELSRSDYERLERIGVPRGFRLAGGEINLVDEEMAVGAVA